MLHPSLTMWCTTNTRACSSGARRSRTERSSGPRARSKGRAAASAARRRSSRSRASDASPARSSRGMRTSSGGRTTCTGSPPSSRRPCAATRAGARPRRGCAPAGPGPGGRAAAAGGHVVGGAPRLHPVHQPEPLLRERQRGRPVARRAADPRSAPPSACPAGSSEQQEVGRGASRSWSSDSSRVSDRGSGFIRRVPGVRSAPPPRPGGSMAETRADPWLPPGARASRDRTTSPPRRLPQGKNELLATPLPSSSPRTPGPRPYTQSCRDPCAIPLPASRPIPCHSPPRQGFSVAAQPILIRQATNLPPGPAVSEPLLPEVLGIQSRVAPELRAVRSASAVRVWETRQRSLAVRYSGARRGETPPGQLGGLTHRVI